MLKLLLLLGLLAVPLQAQTATRVNIISDQFIVLRSAHATLRCYAYRANGTVINNTCNWTSRNTAIATVTTPAKITTIHALAAGITWLVAGRSGVRDSIRLLVAKITLLVPDSTHYQFGVKQRYCRLIVTPNGVVWNANGEEWQTTCVKARDDYAASHNLL